MSLVKKVVSFISSNRLEVLLFVILSTIFLYFRLTPLINQTIPFTYDQGRDFLKAKEIIVDRNISFIGPTTGIDGIFHGAWWYYLLGLFFLFTRGNPIGFYFGVFVFHSISILLFYIFLRKEFNYIVALFFYSFIAVLPYFVSMSIYTANNFIAPIWILLFIASTYYLFKLKDKSKWAVASFFTGLSLSCIFEFEVAFGILIILAFCISFIINRQLKDVFRNIPVTANFIFGLLIPLIPRILFELKNSFIQSKAVIRFLSTPSANNPHTIDGVFWQRVYLFERLVKDIIIIDNRIIIQLVIFLIFMLFFRFKNNLNNATKKFTQFIISIILILFLLSLLNKDNFFFQNYMEGIQYVFLFVILITFYSLANISNKISYNHIILGISLVFSLLLFMKDINKNKFEAEMGLQKHINIINKINQETENDDYCLKIYTPPVVPYTYDYLIDYYSRVYKYKRPSREAVSGQCYYLIENDQYPERLSQWRKNNIPQNAIRINRKNVSSDVLLELWKI